MYFIWEFFLLICLFGCSWATNEVISSFHSHNIVPELIKVAPRHKAVIKFGLLEVKLGNELKPSQVQTPPTITYPLHRRQYYTLAFLDPDAPSRQNPFERAFAHWLVGNIPQTSISSGTTLAEFIGSGPPPDSGEHRYTFLIYKQPCLIEFNETKLTTSDFEQRKFFNVNEFAEKYDLENPYAGNFYTAFHED